MSRTNTPIAIVYPGAGDMLRKGRNVRAENAVVNKTPRLRKDTTPAAADSCGHTDRSNTRMMHKAAVMTNAW
jgi:hypothetical protein